ncbi:D-tyrosyl-tRNA(Tyr) deacylase [Pirellulimonas nuda]|uniref:D-aminoacyl-tRNA deacylase n=1 Tax=Pirellulimonas nuda TaxID=2528009 RepID=A0A518DA33_9BACT|nr:D-aminoacyl-tRNA deacylase [Pirellulimonas nuda]QDU88344.1 D-tyrosyl-tRNA(Tyr) deacylase [Pirellulimonas nuda]
MRSVIQRVSEARVTVDDQVVGQVGAGLLVLLGVGPDDGESQVEWMAEKLVGLRVFEDEHGKMNRSLLDVRGAMLIVSQFTLLGDCRKGRRPSFVNAAPPELAERLYDSFVRAVGRRGVETAAGKFRRQMQVALVNDGPVTLIVDSPEPGGAGDD